MSSCRFFFFFQAEDGIRDYKVTGVQTCALPILAAHPVIWTYYGYPDLAKIAGEVVDPSRTLPRILLGGLAATAVLYLALNTAFLQVLPLERIAASNLVAADVMDALVGARGGALVAGLALLVVLEIGRAHV